MSALVVLRGEGQLLEVARALDASCRLAGLLDRREKEGDEDTDNGDHHQEFDERERPGSRGEALKICKIG